MIPLLDLKSQYRRIGGELDEAVRRVFESGHFVLGPEVAAFEEEFAAYCGTRFAVGVNSGTSALHLALLAAGVGPGDEVITTPFTFAATAAAIHYTGAIPVYVDIEPRTFTLDPARVEASLTARTKALLPVHLYGHPADIDPMMAVARRHGLLVIEDAAQAHGAEYKGRRAGSLGDLACFSFYPGKNLGAAGEGGMVTTSREDLAGKIRLLRDWGQARKYQHEVLGYNYRLEALQAAILRVKLRHLEAWTEERRARAARYSELLSGSGVQPPESRSWGRHVYCVYTVRVAQRDLVRDQLAERGVETAIHYPIPLHCQPAYRQERYQAGDLPQAEAAAREVLSLPLYPEMSFAQVEEAARAVTECATPVADR